RDTVCGNQRNGDEVGTSVAAHGERNGISGRELTNDNVDELLTPIERVTDRTSVERGDGIADQHPGLVGRPVGHRMPDDIPWGGDVASGEGAHRVVGNGGEVDTESRGCRIGLTLPLERWEVKRCKVLVDSLRRRGRL